MRQAEADDGSRRERLTSVEREELGALRREVKDAPLNRNTPNETAAAYRPDTAAKTKTDEQITTKTN
ncbi:hypothetical protein [Gaiella sp.]|uniref:hypothetical protein n=1 Tax=Gaiella sp. TaxID=2663207 RepID=UPI00398371F3